MTKCNLMQFQMTNFYTCKKWVLTHLPQCGNSHRDKQAQGSDVVSDVLEPSMVAITLIIDGNFLHITHPLSYVPLVIN
jgi:hypothetical protein